MRAIVARVLVALLMTSALVALRAGSGAHLAAPSREVSPRLPGREERGEPTTGVPRREETNRPTRSPETRHELTPRRRLCVIASHRPRVSGSPSSPGEPERFAAYLASWLPRAAKVPNGAFSVWVVEQADEYRFNRGWLMNVGVAVSRALDACDVFALHDVDLLPVDARLPYGAFPRVREVLAPSEGDGGANASHASRRIADRTVDAAHLSPPGVHPEYVFRTFKGGAWLFTWDALVRADGYAHVYWGWGLEDDDLGARALAANLSVATRPFPVFRLQNVSSASRRDQCTGFARACAFDPTQTDCLANVPYDSFKKRAFAKTPRTTREGLIVPEGRTLADGVCFAHAHEGTFSRDALETNENARHHPRPSPEFTRGRRWEDVRAGRFRADETTGLKRLEPTGVLGDEGRDANGVSRIGFEKRKKNRAEDEDAPPDPGHGFAVLGLDVVGVRVRRGVAIVANETRHPHAAVASVLDDPALKNHRWSGNALLRRAFGTSASRERASSVADSPIHRFAYPAFARLRVRLTCDEDATPWCVDATRDAWRANETRGEKTR